MHAWTPHRDFAVSKLLTQPLTVSIAAFDKAGARWVILHADPLDHVTADWRRRPERVTGGASG